MKSSTQQPRRWILQLISGVGMGLVLLGTAYAITSDSFRYSKNKTGFISFHHMDFAPDSDSASSDYYNQRNNGLTTNSSGECFQSGAHFPQGAKLKNIVFHYESGAASEFEGYLHRYNLKTDAHSQLVDLIPADDSNTRTSISDTVSNAEGTVDNERFTYAVEVCIGSPDTFYDARVKYSYKSAGD